MLTCITCSKQTEEEEEGSRRGTPSTKDSVKSLTAQIKDMALKLKPCTGSSRRGHRPYPEFDAISEEGPSRPYQAGSSSSTPAWDFATSGHRTTRADSRFSGVLRGDQTPGGSSDVVVEDEDEPKEWMAQVEPGVHITFVSLPGGGNDLKRIRFSREMFDKVEAQKWWGENFDRITELYNVQRFNQQALDTPARSDDARDSSLSRFGYRPSTSRWNPPYETSEHYGGSSSQAGGGGEASRMTTSSRDETSVSYSNAGEVENEWVEEDEAGVYITLRQLADGTRELRRVRFSRERFGERNAKLWWEENRERIQIQYL